MDMLNENYSRWLRGFDIVIGFIVIGIGIWLFFSPTIAEEIIILSLSTALFIIGIIRVVKSIALKNLATVSKAMKVLSGLGAILLSAIVLLFPDLTITFLIVFLALAMMLIGMSRVVVGLKEEDLAQWVKISYTVGGGIIFILAFSAAIFTSLGFFMLILFLSGALITMGILRVASGVSGELK